MDPPIYAGNVTASKQWTRLGEPGPKKGKSVPSAGKMMASVFWAEKGILFIDYLEKRKVITGEYSASILDRLKTEIAEKRSEILGWLQSHFAFFR